MQANIFKIKRNELADGSGLRTTIYFKGCPLRCVWCSTPQAHERPTRILWDSKHCLYCNLCVSECPTGSLAFSDNRLTPDTCTFCRACTDHCPSRMLHFVGQMMNMDEIMEKILADRELYGNGGVILSGGDPLMQPEAATAVLKKCKEHGIRTAIETTAFAKPLAFSRFIANADMIIIDLKHYSSSPASQIIRFWKIWTLPSLSAKKWRSALPLPPASTTRSSMPAGMPTFCLSTTSDM